MAVAITINSNLSALQSQRQLGAASAALGRTYQRLSSGLRINRASDDAAGLAIASSLSADRRVFSQGLRNLNDGLSALSIADGAVSQLSSIVMRIQELAEQAANGTLSSKQRIPLDREAQQLAKEYARITKSAEFNNLKLLDGSVQSLSLQAAYGANGAITSSFGGTIGDGTFTSTVSFITDTAATVDSAIADINGDGKADLVTIGRDGLNGTVTTRLGNGDGTFSAAATYINEISGDLHGLTLGDLNGDGLYDLVTADERAGSHGAVAVRLGRGDGTFGAMTSYAMDEMASFSVAIGDFNGDGIGDLVTQGYTTTMPGFSSVSLRLGRGDGSFGSAVSFNAGNYCTEMKIGDVNGDGVLDIVTAGYDFYVHLGNGNGTFKAISTQFFTIITPNALEVQDFNNDGNLDLLCAGWDSGGGAWSLRLGNGNGTFKAGYGYSDPSDTYNDLSAGDVNGDGNLDLIAFGSEGGQGKIFIRMGNGDGTFAARTSFVAESTDTSGGSIGDLNQDGVLDIVTNGTGGGNARSTVELGNGHSGTSALLQFSLLTAVDAKEGMSLMRQKLSQLAAQRGTIGSFQSRIESAISTHMVTIENYSAAEEGIRGADIATEAAELIRLNILQQAAASVLSQANQQPSIALRLLQA